MPETVTVQTAAPAEALVFGRDQFTESSTTRYVRVAIGDRVAYLRSLPESERAKWDASSLNEKGEVDRDAVLARRARLLAMILVDNKGKRLFTDDEWPMISQADGKVTSKLFTAAVKHLGLGDDSETEAGN